MEISLYKQNHLNARIFIYEFTQESMKVGKAFLEEEKRTQRKGGNN